MCVQYRAGGEGGGGRGGGGRGERVLSTMGEGAQYRGGKVISTGGCSVPWGIS